MDDPHICNLIDGLDDAHGFIRGVQELELAASPEVWKDLASELQHS